MKLKNFQDLLEEQFTKKELKEIEQQAQAEINALKRMQDEVRRAINEYMKKNEIGFNEMIRRLGSNPSQFSKIQKGQANLTMASLAHLSALLDSEPVLTFKRNS